tara:strand:- start:681 stop:1175 length:495 start_codon:yes stop_codon:yes gene_type:complete
MELSKTFIRENKNKTLKELFPDICTTKLVVGKWYESGYGCVVNYQGGESGYGFTKTDRQWYNNDGWGFNRPTDFWELADLSLVAELLVNEALERGFSVGEYFSSILSGSVERCAGGISLYQDDATKLIFGCGNGLIFNNGDWATVIKPITTAEAEAKFKCVIRD